MWLPVQTFAQISVFDTFMQKRTLQNANVPQIIEGHVLVKVHKASINPIDFSNRSGYLQQYIPLQFPITLGSSFSGIVAEIGEGTKGFENGDKVFGSGSQLNGGTGTLAGYVLVPAGFLAHQPSYINDDIAAIIPSSALTAYIALFENGELKAGNKVLIHGGAGGVGSVGIQLAKSANTYVAATVSKNDFGIAKELGADEIIEYKNKAFENVIKNYDVVFDTVGGDTYKKSFEVLKENGSVISVVEQPNTELTRLSM